MGKERISKIIPGTRRVLWSTGGGGGVDRPLSTLEQGTANCVMGKIPEPYKDKNFKASYEKDSISSDIHFNPSWQKRLIKSPVVSGSAPA